MADPYAERESSESSGAPDRGVDPPWLQDLASLCTIVRRAADVDPAAPRLGIVCADSAVIAPIAQIGAPFAALMLADRHGLEGPDLEAALVALSDFTGSIYLLKHGFVAGPQGADGCFAVGGGLLQTVLEAEAAGAVGWELDPDFGYQVPAEVPGLEQPAADALLPRLLYGRHDRVYEHAELVAESKRAWAEALPGEAPAAVVAATGWPIEATGSDWKD